jgi:hypothetical protein
MKNFTKLSLAAILPVNPTMGFNHYQLTSFQAQKNAIQPQISHTTYF